MCIYSSIEERKTRPNRFETEGDPVRSRPDMAEKMALVVALTLLCSCIDVAKCERGSFYDLDDYDGNVVSRTCNGQHFREFSSYDAAVGGLMHDLVLNTPSNGFNRYTVDEVDGARAYGHAACNGEITKDDCGQCLDGAVTYIRSYCGLSIGAQLQVRDCRVRYENYYFTE